MGGSPDPYPRDSVAGHLVALTNEYAGSDGDIFSHTFKNMGLGLLIGKRTWGGVIGISPRYILADGSMTTQPEFSFWFTDVGYKVENYGTDPDILIEIAPQDYHNGTDTQLRRAIAEIMSLNESQPFLMPEFGEKPKVNV
jgi:tricorn protease